MRNLVLFGLFVLLLLAAQFASSKNVDDVIDRYLRARGGRKMLQGLQSVYMEGVRYGGRTEATVRITRQQGRLSRTEFQVGAVSGTVLVTGSDGWTVFSLRTPPARPISAGILTKLQEELDVAGPLVDFHNKGHFVELSGKEMIEGSPCYKVRITTARRSVFIYWIDAGSFLLSHSSVGSVDASGDRQVFTSFRDYRFVDGIAFPHEVETVATDARGKQRRSLIQFRTIIVNPTIDEGLYVPQSE